MNNRVLGKGSWISIGAPIVTEIVAKFGFDWLLFDMEHGGINESNLLANMHAAKNSGVKVIVRIGEYSASLIAHVLDIGVDGIMVPHVESISEAERIVKAMNFPPNGFRGLSTSTRCFTYGLDASQKPENMSQPLFLAQIESYEGVCNAESIASVEGVDMLFVGPRDLSFELSMRHNLPTIEFDDALKRVALAARRSGNQAGILIRDSAKIVQLENYGYTALALGSDMGALKAGLKNIVKNL